METWATISKIKTQPSGFPHGPRDAALPDRRDNIAHIFNVVNRVPRIFGVNIKGNAARINKYVKGVTTECIYCT
jgi:hypothetical protein